MKTPLPEADSRARRTPAVVLVLAIPLLLSACLSNERHGLPHAIGEQLAANAINYNLAMEKSQNEMMLLNVVRAMQHRPLYLTDTSKVTGTVNGSFSLGLSLPFGNGWQGNANVHGPTASPTISYSTSPSMDVNLLDSQDFMAGFLKPIPPKLFAYYWDLGWESEFLLYMLVLKVDEYVPDKTYPTKFILTARYENHPIAGQTDKIEAFSSWVRAVVANGRPKTNSGQPFQHSLLLDSNIFTGGKDSTAKIGLKELDKIAKDQGLSLTPFPNSVDGNPVEPEEDLTPPPPKKHSKEPEKTWSWALSMPDQSWTLEYKHDTKFDPKPDKNSLVDDPKQKLKDPEEIGESAAQSGQFLAIPSDLSRAPGAPIQGPIYVLTLRSPEGVLFYLGELASMANPKIRHPESNYPAKALLIHTWDNLAPESLEPLFMVRPDHEIVPCSAVLSATTLEGTGFLIPAGSDLAPTMIVKLTGSAAGARLGPLLTDSKDLCTGGESMHALSLLSQLIALQKSAKDFPTTSTVKVVGQ